jgi:hypothetical protein
MALVADDITTLAERPHWTVTGALATFAPVERGWRAIVRRLELDSGANRVHVAVIDRTGATRYTREATTLAEAVRHAERDIAARNALRIAPRR